MTHNTEAARLREVLEKYADELCEGWCKENGGYFDDCSGCPARQALQSQPSEANAELAMPEAIGKAVAEHSGRSFDTLWCDPKFREQMEVCANAAARSIATATEALRPFADALDEWGDDERTMDSCTLWAHPLGMCITVGDFRQAAAALRTGQQGVE